MAEWWEESELVEPSEGGEFWEDSKVVEEAAPDEPNFMERNFPLASNIYKGARDITEVGMAVATGALAEPVAGVAGLATAAMEGPQAGAQAVEDVQAGMTYTPEHERPQQRLQQLGTAISTVLPVEQVATFLGETTLDVTGSPAAAAAAHAVPTALMEALGLGMLKRGSRVAETVIRESDRAPPAALQPEVKNIDEITADLKPKMVAEDLMPGGKTYEQITADLKKGGKKGKVAVAEQVMPDLQLLADAEKFGIQLNPGHYSTNEAFRRVEGAIKSQPGSMLEVNELKAIEDLGNAADDLVKEYAGTLDRAFLETELHGKMSKLNVDLGEVATDLYDRVNDNIPAATKVNPTISRAYIEKKLEGLGGDASGLSAPALALYDVLSQTVKKGKKDVPREITYARLDALRKEVAKGYKKQGAFKDETSGALDSVYSVLVNDQQSFANGIGRAADGTSQVGKTFELARKMVESRKNLQKDMVSLFGKDLESGFIRKLTGAASGMSKGDVANFKKIMGAMPDHMRPAVSAMLLNDLFTMGTRAKGGSIGGGFAGVYRALDRHPTAKNELFKYLPKDARNTFDAIGRLSESIYRGKMWENHSRTSAAILQGLQDGTIAQKLHGAQQAVRVAGGGGVVSQIIEGGIGIAKATTDRIKAADKLMSSGELNKVLDKAMEGKVKEAETMLKRSKKWQRFRELLGPRDTKLLLAMGPIAWLTQQEQPPEGQPVGQ